MKVTIHQISTLEEMERVEESWNKFMRKYTQPPFLFSDFAKQFFNTSMKRDSIPSFLIISAKSRIVGVLPLGINNLENRFNRFLPIRFCKFLPINALHPDLVCDNKYREICWKHTLNFIFKTLRCQFAYLSFSAKSPNLNKLRQVCRQQGIYFSMIPEPGYSIIQVKEVWEDFARKRGKSYRKQIRRIERRLSSSGSWKISFLGRQEEESILFRKIMAIERASWKQFQRKNKKLSFDPTLSFIWNGSRHVAAKENEFDWGTAILELNGKAVAYSLFTKYKTTAYLCKTSFDERYRKEYLGIYINHALIRQLFNRSDIEKIDFMTDLPFHRKWADPPTPHIKLIMSQKNLFPILLRYSSHPPISSLIRGFFALANKKRTEK